MANTRIPPSKKMSTSEQAKVAGQKMYEDMKSDMQKRANKETMKKGATKASRSQRKDY